jgi:hypothetical protein
MSGIGQGFQGDQWHGKQLLKNLIGLPVAGAIGSPQWIKKNPQSAMAAAAVAATILSAGAAAPAIAGATSAGSAAAGAGAIGAGEGALAAGTALPGGAVAGMGGGTASLFGPSAAGAGLLSSGMAGSAELAGMGAGTAGLFGPSAGLASGLLSNAATPAIGGSLGTVGQAGMLAKLQGLLGSEKVKSGMDAFNNYQKVQSVMDQATPKGGGTAQVSPRGPAPQYGQIGAPAPDAPPKTPYSKFDPQWVDYLKRHPELGAMYG